MEQNNWGVRTESSQKNNSAQQWGYDKGSKNYHDGYAAVLKSINWIISFVIPFIGWTIFAATMYQTTEMGGGAVALAIFGYIITAFVLWVMMSYKAYMFDNISKIAKNTDLILQKQVDERVDR